MVYKSAQRGNISLLVNGWTDGKVRMCRTTSVEFYKGVLWLFLPEFDVIMRKVPMRQQIMHTHVLWGGAGIGQACVNLAHGNAL